MDEIEINKQAPNFRLPATSGGEVELAEYRGKQAVVLFFVRAYN